MFQVKIDVSHHALREGALSRVKEIVFCMDDPVDLEQSKKKKKPETLEASIKSFGSYLNVSKVKSCSYVTLAWRCRLEDHNRKK